MTLRPSARRSPLREACSHVPGSPQAFFLVDGQTAEAKAIRRAIDGLASELRDQLEEQEGVIATQSDRIAALERHIVAQEAEARGIRRALGWGATILSGAGVLLGWFLSKFGTVILYSLGLGGSGGGK